MGEFYLHKFQVKAGNSDVLKLQAYDPDGITPGTVKESAPRSTAFWHKFTTGSQESV